MFFNESSFSKVKSKIKEKKKDLTNNLTNKDYYKQKLRHVSDTARSIVDRRIYNIKNSIIRKEKEIDELNARLSSYKETGNRSSYKRTKVLISIDRKLLAKLRLELIVLNKKKVNA